MSRCRVFSCGVGRGCLLWLVCSLGKTLLAFALLHSVLQGQICLFSRYFLTSYFSIPVPYNEKDIHPSNTQMHHFLGVSSRRSCRSSQNHSTSASSALLVGAQTWITVIFNGLPSKQTEIILSRDFIQVLHFGLFSWPWWLLHFFWGIPAHSSRHNGHLS